MIDSRTLIVIGLCFIAGYAVIHSLMKFLRSPRPVPGSPRDRFFANLLELRIEATEGDVREALAAKAVSLAEAPVSGSEQDRLVDLYQRIALLNEAYDYYRWKYGWAPLKVSILPPA